MVIRVGVGATTVGTVASAPAAPVPTEACVDGTRGANALVHLLPACQRLASLASTCSSGALALTAATSA